VLTRSIRGLLVAPVFVFIMCGGVGTIMTSGAPSGATTPRPQAASSGPACTFNGSTLPLATGVSAGSKIAVSCTGLPPLNPYMLVGTSLVLTIDPVAAPLLSGQITSLSALMRLLAAPK